VARLSTRGVCGDQQNPPPQDEAPKVRNKIKANKRGQAD